MVPCGSVKEPSVFFRLQSLCGPQDFDHCLKCPMVVFLLGKCRFTLFVDGQAMYKIALVGNDKNV
uniref:Uncharacterized protein n=1 Tax=Anguilla anguilla TaxID=7936 RepID=A0A0E9WHE6_ANGAN